MIQVILESSKNIDESMKRSLELISFNLLTWFIFIIGFLSYTSALILRHFWFQTSAWDLGIFDQAIFLISKGLPAQSSLLGFHILGDHGALILYPLGLISNIFPSILYLFFIQGFVLSSAVFPLSRLAVSRGLSKRSFLASLLMLLLYPVVFNVAIFDFHPEVIAFPLILEIIILLEKKENLCLWKLFIYLVFVLTCKVSLSLLVFGIGISVVIKGRKLLGSLIIGLASIWLYLIGFLLIPAFGNENARLIRHASKFGFANENVFDINNSALLITQLFKQAFSLSTFEYIFLLIIPVIYLIFHFNRTNILFSLVPFAPLFLLNVFSAQPSLKDLVHQYSLFLVPFLADSVQQTLAPGLQGINGYPIWMRRRLPEILLFWMVFIFLILSRASFFFGTFQERLNTASDRRAVISKVHPSSALLTSNDLVPHLSRRKKINFITNENLDQINEFDQILIDEIHPGWQSSKEIVDRLLMQLNTSESWVELYRSGSVVLFQKNSRL